MSKSDVYQSVLRPMQAVFSAPPHVSKTEEGFALEQYATAMRSFDERDLAEGWARVRDTNTRGFWPPIGLLVEACGVARRQRLDSAPKRQALNGRIIDGEYQSWGGACRCARCAEKAPSAGFYRAPTEVQERSLAERKELDDWMAYQVERLPTAKHGEAVGTGPAPAM